MYSNAKLKLLRPGTFARCGDFPSDAECLFTLLHYPYNRPMPSPLQRFKNDLQQPHFYQDPAQANAVDHIQRLYSEITQTQNNRTFLTRLLQRKKRQQLPQGLYFWGGVGRGKTYLMGLLFDCLPIEQKLRTHFHRFMRDIHRQLDRYKGMKNPLLKIADDYATRYQIICFDEFFVTDIADAMILASLLQAFIDRRIIFVATSNIEPMRLYENGLQRQHFLPAITILEDYTEIVNIDNGTDYRLRTLTQANLFYYPLSEQTHNHLLAAYSALVPTQPTHNANSKDAPTKAIKKTLTINGRDFAYQRCHGEVIWFYFNELCNKPHSQNDYLELASLYRTMLISDVPQLNSDRDDAARRFINLIDVFYDARIKLIISAEVPLADIYTGKYLNFPFQRTISRLQEMQSEGYLAQPHNPPSSLL